MTTFKALQKISVAVVLAVLAFSATPAFAEEALPEVPWWQVDVGSRPSYLAPGGEGTVVVSATNLGDNNVNGEVLPVTVTDTLPKGIEVTSAYYLAGRRGANGKEGCPHSEVSGSQVVVCSFSGMMAAYKRLEVVMYVKVGVSVAPGKPADGVKVSGGGASSLSVSDPLTISESPVPFGVETYEFTPENADGSLDTQAGSHPFQLTTTLTLNAGVETYPGRKVEELEGEIGRVAQPALPKDLHFALPPGLVGNPTPFPQCPEALFFKEECAVDTQLGVEVLTLANPIGLTITEGVYNVPPAPGEPARFAFEADGVPVFIDTAVRTGADYGVTASSDNITELSQFLSSQTTFWGVPSDPRHNRSRYEFPGEENSCLGHVSLPPSCPNDVVSAPFLAMPTSCGNPTTEPFKSTVEGDSWSAPGKSTEKQEPLPYILHDAGDPSIALDGCEGLNFEPSIKVTPDGKAGSSPSGLNVDVHVPQSSVLVPNGDAESDLKNITVALPEGLQLNPSAADGLGACSQGQVGLSSDGEAACPDSSKIGTVTIKTPLLPNPLKGFVYLASPQNFAGLPENPFGSLVAMYVVAKDPVSGVLIKLAGKVSLGESGQITTTFENNPQLPFEDAELEFFGGERAPLASPAHCGAYTASASFAPWSGDAAVPSSSTFKISSGPNGSACPGSALPFAPALHSSSANLQAGGFTPFTTTFSREDGQQNLQGLQLHLPAGLSGLLTGVELCGEAQADAGTCGPNSLIGETIVSVGVGGDPFSVTGGKVYITGPYEGAPFGLSIVNPAKAGPFDLQEGRPVVVRAKIEVDPLTAALTVTTDNTGPYKIPTIIDGVPLQIKHINVTINRSSFTFNPTDCNPARITGSIQSTEGASSNVEVPFQVTNCAALKFAPKFSASTSGKTSKANGASLKVNVSFPHPGPQSSSQSGEANIAKVHVELPKVLPSRLETLQKACTYQQFEANPAGCPAASIVGHAIAHTPILNNPLQGPAYFVSHGSAKFPELIMVLQGEGITIDLAGETFISKAGVTSSTFAHVPDAPVSSFELLLPQQRYSALAANGNLCTEASKLLMPTQITAQNGAVFNQSTHIEVSGCPNALSVVSRSLRGHTLTLKVSVPAAGRLKASGKGLSSVSKGSGGRETVTVRLHVKRHGRTRVRLSFSPKKGARQSKSLTVHV